MHDCLGMILDSSHQGEVYLSMPKHLDNVQKTFENGNQKPGGQEEEQGEVTEDVCTQQSFKSE